MLISVVEGTSEPGIPLDELAVLACDLKDHLLACASSVPDSKHHARKTSAPRAKANKRRGNQRDQAVEEDNTSQVGCSLCFLASIVRIFEYAESMTLQAILARVPKRPPV